jgi:hypothetical protein
MKTMFMDPKKKEEPKPKMRKNDIRPGMASDEKTRRR